MKEQIMNQFLDFQEAIITEDKQTQLKGGFIVEENAEGFIVEDDLEGV